MNKNRYKYALNQGLNNFFFTIFKGTPRCSRYQFECKTSSECIAIYNACDGIPQCSDGSDEALELACPTTPSKIIELIRICKSIIDLKFTFAQKQANKYL